MNEDYNLNFRQEKKVELLRVSVKVQLKELFDQSA